MRISGAEPPTRKCHMFCKKYKALYSLIITLPKFNSSPLKSHLPNRKVIFQPPFFRGELLNFAGVYLVKLGHEPTSSLNNPSIRPDPLKFQRETPSLDLFSNVGTLKLWNSQFSPLKKKWMRMKPALLSGGNTNPELTAKEEVEETHLNYHDCMPLWPYQPRKKASPPAAPTSTCCNV